VSCQPGTFASMEGGSVQCITAPAGKYATSVSNTSGIPDAYPCPYGSYSDRQGSYSCTTCPIGTSTNITGSTSAADCVPCSFGVDAFTYRCLDDNSHLNDLCWNSGQLLSLVSSIVVNDLFRLVYQKPIVGMSALISDTIDVIQQSSMSSAGPSDVALGVGASNMVERDKTTPTRLSGQTSVSDQQ
jgi:hypothetical protein